ELRDLIVEWGSDPVRNGLGAALAAHASRLGARDGLAVDADIPGGHLPLSPSAEKQLFAIGREALSNVVKHGGAERAWVHVEAGRERVLLEIGDNGRGFDPAAGHPGHFGLESMRSRAAEI